MASRPALHTIFLFIHFMNTLLFLIHLYGEWHALRRHALQSEWLLLLLYSESPSPSHFIFTHPRPYPSSGSPAPHTPGAAPLHARTHTHTHTHTHARTHPRDGWGGRGGCRGCRCGGHRGRVEVRPRGRPLGPCSSTPRGGPYSRGPRRRGRDGVEEGERRPKVVERQGEPRGVRRGQHARGPLHAAGARAPPPVLPALGVVVDEALQENTWGGGGGGSTGHGGRVLGFRLRV